VQIQAQFDQVLLAGMRTTQEVGYYNVALRMISIWTFFPMAIATAAAPEITRAWTTDRRLYSRRMRDVYRALLLAGGGAATFVAIFASPLIRIVFGAGYSASIGLLPLLSLRIILANLGVARGLFITNEGLFRHAMWTAAGGAIMSIVLNLILIPRLGPRGCIIAGLASFTTTTILLDFLHPRARRNLLTVVSALGLRRLPTDSEGREDPAKQGKPND
jgi:O-antigen/teichoic acid export membrane protein